MEYATGMRHSVHNQNSDFAKHRLSSIVNMAYTYSSEQAIEVEVSQGPFHAQLSYDTMIQGNYTENWKDTAKYCTK